MKIQLFLAAMLFSCIVSAQTNTSNRTCIKFTANGVSFTMVKVKCGTFTMGVSPVESGRIKASNAHYDHEVTITKDYYIGQTEVTQELWKAVMGTNPSEHKGLQYPVESINWTNCNNFIAKLNRLTGEVFRLPTEAEWEFAAKGGIQSRHYIYAGSDDIEKVGWRTDETHPVGLKQPNELGIYDMSGNAEEWCQDIFETTYPYWHLTDPTGPSEGDHYVARGGRPIPTRQGHLISHRGNKLGFRLALSKVSHPDRTEEVPLIIADRKKKNVNNSSEEYTVNTSVEVDGGTSTIGNNRSKSITVKSSVENDGSNIFTINDVNFKMILVDGGTFTMGNKRSKSPAVKPEHKVILSSFFIGETEVTQELWTAVMGQNPSEFKGSNLPVEHVSWDDCQQFVTKLSEMTGAKFRLPTEAEWEFAARGGNRSKNYMFSGSNNVDDVAIIRDPIKGQTYSVKYRMPNELGIYGMSGNVSEWCYDWFDNYDKKTQTNPTGPSHGKGRVIRGASFMGPRNYYLWYRTNSKPMTRISDTGLRLVMTK